MLNKCYVPSSAIKCVNYREYILQVDTNLEQLAGGYDSEPQIVSQSHNPTRKYQDKSLNKSLAAVL